MYFSVLLTMFTEHNQYSQPSDSIINLKELTFRVWRSFAKGHGLYAGGCFENCSKNGVPSSLSRIALGSNEQLPRQELCGQAKNIQHHSTEQQGN